MRDTRTYIKIEGFEAEVDVDTRLIDPDARKSSYGVALMLEGPMQGYEVLICYEDLMLLHDQWEKENTE